jgi:hypothetical protein
MAGYGTRAAEAVEQQVRYWRMLEDPQYRAWADKRHDAHRGINPAAALNSVMVDHAARVATAVGEPFWWSPQICRLIEATYSSMPSYELARENLPAPGGFFWFATPIDVTGGARLKAIAWAQVLPDGEPNENGGIRAKAVSARANTLQDASSICAAFFETTGELRTVSNDPQRQRWETPMASIFWSFGKSYQEQQARDLVTGDAPKGEYDGTAESRVFASAIAFLNQKILVSPRQEIDRSARRRLAANKVPHEPLVRVVALRRAFERLSGADKQSGDPVEWSCHWMVGARTGGFWRQQYMGDGRHEPRFIVPFVKGDLDKPFKPPTKVAFSVHR